MLSFDVILVLYRLLLCVAILMIQVDITNQLILKQNKNNVHKKNIEPNLGIHIANGDSSLTENAYVQTFDDQDIEGQKNIDIVAEEVKMYSVTTFDTRDNGYVPTSEKSLAFVDQSVKDQKYFGTQRQQPIGSQEKYGLSKEEVTENNLVTTTGTNDSGYVPTLKKSRVFDDQNNEGQEYYGFGKEEENEKSFSTISNNNVPSSENLRVFGNQNIGGKQYFGDLRPNGDHVYFGQGEGEDAISSDIIDNGFVPFPGNSRVFVNQNKLGKESMRNQEKLDQNKTK